MRAHVRIGQRLDCMVEIVTSFGSAGLWTLAPARTPRPPLPPSARSTRQAGHRRSAASSTLAGSRTGARAWPTRARRSSPPACVPSSRWPPRALPGARGLAAPCAAPYSNLTMRLTVATGAVRQRHRLGEPVHGARGQLVRLARRAAQRPPLLLGEQGRQPKERCLRPCGGRMRTVHCTLGCSQAATAWCQASAVHAIRLLGMQQHRRRPCERTKTDGRQ